MLYKDLKDGIDRKAPTDYEQLMKHSQVIILAVGKTSKMEVATDLNISPQAFSIIYKCILAYDRIQG